MSFDAQNFLKVFMKSNLSIFSSVTCAFGHGQEITFKSKVVKLFVLYFLLKVVLF